MGCLVWRCSLPKEGQRKIGIRKVLGASVTDLVGMLTKEIVVLVLIAILLASPIAWYFMNQWLQGFAFRINVVGGSFYRVAIAALKRETNRD